MDAVLLSLQLEKGGPAADKPAVDIAVPRPTPPPLATPFPFGDDAKTPFRV